MKDSWRALGTSALNDGGTGNTLLPFTWWEEVCWKQTFEYPVGDFLTEVGFYLDVLGVEPASLSEDYALLTTPNEDFAFSFRKVDNQPDLSPFSLQFFTNNLDTVLETIAERHPDHRVFEGAPGQRVIGLTSPAGLPIEIWSGFEG